MGSTSSSNAKTQIIDVGGSQLTPFFQSLLREALLWTDKPYAPGGHTQRLLPSAFLSDDAGLQIWSELTRAPNYYQTEAEAELILEKADELSRHIQDGTIIMDLGCGDVRKIVPLLQALEKQKKSVTYYAIDLARSSLENGLQRFDSGYNHVQCIGLWGTWDAALAWSKKTLNDPGRPRLYLSLGSIFGNDHPDPSAARLRDWAQKAMRETTAAEETAMMLLTMDATTDRTRLHASYNDNDGLYERFIRNGFRHSNRILGEDWYKDEDWDCRSVLQGDPVMHRSVLRAKRPVAVQSVGLTLEEGTEVDCYENFKYGPEAMSRQFEAAGISAIEQWKAPKADIYQYLLVAKGREKRTPGLQMKSLLWIVGYGSEVVGTLGDGTRTVLDRSI
ncbi:hypothetical protein PG993_013223 [Apiospora rasikravindrae]|uniref:Histidine-specific methyltransferase SAM-dependent domain-containing protein n=1 Tax=Apiospora rasikravindrae TaxID=990691 RepID=A0ABR1RX37_9PEZI